MDLEYRDDDTKFSLMRFRLAKGGAIVAYGYPNTIPPVDREVFIALDRRYSDLYIDGGATLYRNPPENPRITKIATSLIAAAVKEKVELSVEEAMRFARTGALGPLKETLGPAFFSVAHHAKLDLTALPDDYLMSNYPDPWFKGWSVPRSSKNTVPTAIHNHLKRHREIAGRRFSATAFDRAMSLFELGEADEPVYVELEETSSLPLPIVSDLADRIEAALQVRRFLVINADSVLANDTLSIIRAMSGVSVVDNPPDFPFKRPSGRIVYTTTQSQFAAHYPDLVHHALEMTFQGNGLVDVMMLGNTTKFSQTLTDPCSRFQIREQAEAYGQRLAHPNNLSKFGVRSARVLTGDSDIEDRVEWGIVVGTEEDMWHAINACTKKITWLDTSPPA